MDKPFKRILEIGREVQREVAISEAFGSVPGISISIEKEFPNAISLHYKPDKDLSKGVKWELFNTALPRLEQLLQRFPDITNIYATTWIAFKHAKFFEKYGFTVTKPEENESGEYSFANEQHKALHAIYIRNRKKFGMSLEHKKLPPAIAEFSREKFLAPDAEWRKWVARTEKRQQKEASKLSRKWF